MAATYGSAGVLAYAASPVSGTHPAGTPFDVAVFIVGQKEAVGSGAIVSSDPALTKAGEQLTSVGVAGADTGPVRIAAFYRVLDGNEPTTTYAFTGSPDVMFVQPLLVTKAYMGAWTITAAVGQDVTAGAAWSAVLAALNLAAGDLCIVGSVIPTDVTTPAQFTLEAVAAAGMTFGAMTEISEPDTTTGNDLGGFVFVQAITAGAAASVAPTVTATAAGTTTNVVGATILVRLRIAEADRAREASAREQVNIGAVDVTAVAITEASAREQVNVKASLAEILVPVEPFGWGALLDETMVEVLPPSPDDEARMHVKIT